jgi:hypothetical protein
MQDSEAMCKPPSPHAICKINNYIHLRKYCSSEECKEIEPISARHLRPSASQRALATDIAVNCHRIQTSRQIWNMLYFLDEGTT